MKPNVFIAPGVAEGPWHVARLAHALEKVGLKHTTQLNTADIVVTHSGGFHILPKPVRGTPNFGNPQLLIAVNPPYWPSKPIIGRIIDVVWKEIVGSTHDKTLGLCFKKTLMNIVYLIHEPLYGWRVWLSMRRHSPAELLNAPQSVVVRNDEDAWCTPEIKKYIGEVTLIELSGRHDDCWYNPDKYATLIRDLWETTRRP